MNFFTDLAGQSSEHLARPVCWVSYAEVEIGCNLTSSRVWIPAEFCADCSRVSTAVEEMDQTFSYHLEWNVGLRLILKSTTLRRYDAANGLGGKWAPAWVAQALSACQKLSMT